jgi:hypothetical protein
VPGLPAAREGNKHWDVLPIFAIGIAVKMDQVALLELNRQKDVGGRRD